MASERTSKPRRASPQRSASAQNSIGAADARAQERPARPARTPTARTGSPVNAIKPARAREANRQGSPVSANARFAGEPRADSAAPPDSRRDAIPPQVADRFVQVGKKFYFANGDPAFKDRGNRLTTQSENTEVIRSLLEIAQARGWERIEVSGTQRFRQEAWIQAMLAGLEVRGYKASAIEQAQLARRIDRERRGARDRERSGDDLPSAPSSTAQADRPESRPPIAEERIYRGRLVDHGVANYQFNPREPHSYYVRLENAQGEQVLWGRDLERAIGKSLSEVKLGDEVAVRRVGERPVTVHRPRRDEEGRVQGEESVLTYRNRWLVEKESFLRSRAQLAKTVRDPQIDAKTAARHRPELTGTYVELRAAELVAKEAYADARDRLRFVARVREAIAAEIERGEPLSAVRVREPERFREPPAIKKPERTQARVLA